jgi:hypothetical protein
MLKKPLEAFGEHFSKVNDPRKDRTKDRKLIDIIVIAICAVICGAEGWVDVELFGKSKLHWLETFFGTTEWNSFTRHVWTGVLDDCRPPISTGFL